jgi:hypothetical protein
MAGCTPLWLDSDFFRVTASLKLEISENRLKLYELTWGEALVVLFVAVAIAAVKAVNQSW